MHIILRILTFGSSTQYVNSLKSLVTLLLFVATQVFRSLPILKINDIVLCASGGNSKLFQTF